MEPVFTTETIHDLSVHQEFRKSFLYASKLRGIANIIYCFLIVWYISLFDIERIVYIYLALTLFLLVLYLLNNRKSGDIQYKRMLQAGDGEPPHLIIHLCEDAIHCSDRKYGNRRDYRYDLFRYLIDTPHLLILVMQHQSCLILEKRWLRGGTAQDLMAFLLLRCPNIRPKKPKGITFGKWTYRIVTVFLVIGAIMAVCSLPGISLFDRLSGRLTNDMRYQQMAEELAPLGITISERTIEDLEAYDAEYAAEYGMDYYDGDEYASKIADLLYWEGSGIYDPETCEWTPSRSGIYWFDTEVWDVSAIYSDFFTGLSAMHPALAFTNVTEDYSKVDIEGGTGTVCISFDLNNQHYELEAEYCYDWFDTSVLSEVLSILRTDNKPENLYFAYDGQAVFLYYGSSQQAEQLSRKSGFDFSDTIRMGFLS